MPNPGADRRQNLSLLVESPPCSKSAGLPVVMSTEDLAKWGAMDAGAAAVGERDQRSSQFHGLTTRLSSSSWPLLTSATELHSVVKKMAEEVDQLLSELRAEVANYRARLAQLEKREAVDLLTGLANRREVEAQIEERISWKSVFCLAILDLNGFKW